MVESRQNRAITRGKCNDIKLPMKNKYTWRQVAERNNEKEAWIIVDDKVYDITGMCEINVLKRICFILITFTNRMVV